MSLVISSLRYGFGFTGENADIYVISVTLPSVRNIIGCLLC